MQCFVGQSEGMVVVGGESAVSIVLGHSSAGEICIGPLYVRPDLPYRTPEGGYDFIFGPIVAVADDGTRFVRESGNGIDSLRLAHLRTDLGILERERVGSVHVGDHDYFEILGFVASGEGMQVRFTHPSLDIWDLEITTIGWERASAIVEQIDEVERAFGLLTGCCGACGVPSSTYESSATAGHEFLVTYAYDVGELSGVVLADSEESIAALYPELVVARVQAAWIGDDRFRALRDEQRLRLDVPPSGVLSAVVADRAD